MREQTWSTKHIVARAFAGVPGRVGLDPMPTVAACMPTPRFALVVAC
jgi:hypothetical protein